MSGSREWSEEKEAGDDKRITIKDDSIPLASVEPAKEKDDVVDEWEHEESDRESERDITPDPEAIDPQPPAPQGRGNACWRVWPPSVRTSSP